MAAPAPKKKKQAEAKEAANFSAVDLLVQEQINDRAITGAVLLVGHGGKIVHQKAFGLRATSPRVETMTLDTIFDLASLTKVVATTPSVMRLIQYGQVRLDEPVAHYIPDFGMNGKDAVTVRQLLTHYSGLRPDIDLNPSGWGAMRRSDWRMKKSCRRRRAQSLYIATPISWCWASWCNGFPACRWTSMRTCIFSSRWA